MSRPKQHLQIIALLWAAIIICLAGCKNKERRVEAVRIRWSHDPETLDPMHTPNQAGFDAINLLCLSLLQTDASTHKYAPALAETLPVVRLVGDSLMRLDYHIRAAATWDDGRPVQARDVEFSLKLMFCPGLPNESIRNQYRFVQAVLTDPKSPQHFTMVCQGQSPEYAHASGDFFVQSEAALDPQGTLRRYSLAELQRRPNTAPADSGLQAVARRYLAAGTAALAAWPGCGPYRLTQWKKDRYLRFQRKPNWWADQLQPVPFVLQAKPKQLDFVIIPDAATATLALRGGELDVYPLMPAREFNRLRHSTAAQAGLRFYTALSHNVVTAGFNTRRPILADALTRQALSRCFDATALLRATQLGDGQRTVGIISPSNRINYNDSLALIPFDLNGAASLLRQAGWRRTTGPAGGWYRPGPRATRQNLQLRVRYRANEDIFATVALQFRAAATELGVPVVLLPTESGAFSQALQEGDFDVYVRILMGNPFVFNFTPILHTLGVGAGNSTGFSSSRADRLIEAIAAANGPARRAQLLHRFQALMQQEAPLVPLFFVSTRVAAGRGLTGLHVNSLKPGYTVATIERPPTSTPLP